MPDTWRIAGNPGRRHSKPPRDLGMSWAFSSRPRRTSAVFPLNARTNRSRPRERLTQLHGPVDGPPLGSTVFASMGALASSRGRGGRATGRWRRSSPSPARSDRSRVALLQPGFERWLSSLARAVLGDSNLGLERSVSTSGAAGVGGAHQLVHDPRAAQHRCRCDAVRGPQRDRALPRHTQRRESSSVTRRNCEPSTDAMP